jgi:Peptidase family M1 domain
MTKVTRKVRRVIPLIAAFCLSASTLVDAQGAKPANAGSPADGPARALYLQLQNVGLDSNRVYRVRDASLDRASMHIELTDGTIGFTQDVQGKITGAFFEGDGEVLLSPPSRVERGSMALFTGAAILEERFNTAYFRFNDDTVAKLQPSLLPIEEIQPQGAQQFVTKWDFSARTLAQLDPLRLFLTFAQFLPNSDRTVVDASSQPDPSDSFLHSRIQGLRLGTFDIYFDAQSPEQLRVTQIKTAGDQTYLDTWASFAPNRTSNASDDLTSDTGDGASSGPIRIAKYTIQCNVKPPTQIDADAELQIEVRESSQRAFVFELSRFLQVERVEADGQPIEFIHNPAVEGSHLASRGDDLLAIVLPKPLVAGQKMRLRFKYGGAVLSNAGGGLLYVGARGTWYPNRGLAAADYDLEFRYPAGWDLVATGKPAEVPASEASTNADQVARFVSEGPTPLAGFNLGRYVRASARAGDATITVYAAHGVEKDFPRTAGRSESPDQPVNARSIAPSPARNAQHVADAAAEAVDFFAHRFGPFPYGQLSLTQMPGDLSQGWPGLIFLSSYSFLTNDERATLRMAEVDRTLSNSVLVHETAHQWWGDAVGWAGYRDQWIVEALANYSALMLLESKDPSQFRAVMERYRDDLLITNKDGIPFADDGPVTLGGRLSNSHFPEGYAVVSYERGTWLFHMLRCMMRDAERNSPASKTSSEEPFVRALRKLREKYDGKAMTTTDLLHVFESELRPSNSYEGLKSLDWFRQGWVDGTAIPQYSLNTVRFAQRGEKMIASGAIMQKSAPEDIVTSVPVYAVSNKATIYLGRVFADGPETQFHFAVPAGTHKLLLDPGQTVLRREK